MGCDLLVTQSFLIMCGLKAVKDIEIYMYASFPPFESDHFCFNPCDQVFSPHPLLWDISQVLCHSLESNFWLLIPIFCKNTQQNSCLNLWNITTLFITLWTPLKMKAGRRNVSIKLSQPSFLWKLIHGYLPFYSWVGLLVWDCSTVLAMHLLVFLANLAHREVCVCLYSTVFYAFHHCLYSAHFHSLFVILS